VLLGDVEPVVSDPLDELAAPDVISSGSTQFVTPRVVDGRRYAAFAVGTSLRLKRLTWLNVAGKEIASTTALPVFGYTQFQP